MHLMLDVETLGTGADAALTQAGLVAFDPEADGIADEGLSLNIDPDASIAAGLKVEWATIHWWMSQPEAARTLPLPGTGMKLSEAMAEIAKYVGKWPDVWIWSNGAAFDIPIVETAMRRCRIGIPWKYNRVLDVRTLKVLAPEVDRPAPTVAHNALSDAVAQAIWVQRMWKALKTGRAGEEVQRGP